MNVIGIAILAALVAAPIATRAQSGWSTPQAITELNTPYGEGWAHTSDDGLTLYYSRYNVGGPDAHYWAQLYQATRSIPSGVFSAGTRIRELAFEGHVHSAWVSPDNLHMYFLRTEGASEWVIRESVRPTADSSWAPPSKLTEFNSFEDVANPELSADELTIVFDVYAGESTGALYTASRSDRNAPFSNIQPLTALNNGDARAVDLTGDGLTLYFSRLDGSSYHTYVSTRPDRQASFTTATRVTAFPDDFHMDDISADGRTAYLGRGGDMYVSHIGAVPEPSTLVQLALGLMAMAGASHASRRRRVAAPSCR